jgi:sortase (surface protein transpeptidase)
VTPPSPVGRRGPSWLAAAALSLTLVTGTACAGGGQGSGEAGGGEAAGSSPAPTPAPAPPTTPAPSPPPPPGPPVDGEAAAPTRVVIPRIGVDAPVVALGLDAAGALEAPHTAHETGWWEAGPEPGEAGPAVIAGHVDSRRDPAVFFRLKELVPGDTVEVRRADGSSVTFVVERREQHPKAAFPTGSVYDDTAGAALRLITCGGVFDRSTRHYVDNVIVFATRR